jgi:hypothetical protein
MRQKKRRISTAEKSNRSENENMQSIHLLISIDDTDNLDSPGSGTAAENMARAMQKKGLAQCSDITRHQLFVHEAIPYTSGNSAMCFSAVGQAGALAEIIRFSADFLRQEAAAGSDPGLCVAQQDCRLDKKALISFGQRAKHTVIDKQAAYDLARELGLHLSEHGGTGGGIIGALAAIGLRLHGSDGRFRGWYRLGKAGEVTTPATLCAHPFIDAVVADTGEWLSNDTSIIFTEDKVKTVLLNGLQAIPVTRTCRTDNQAAWMTLDNKAIKQY